MQGVLATEGIREIPFVPHLASTIPSKMRNSSLNDLPESPARSSTFDEERAMTLLTPAPSSFQMVSSTYIRSFRESAVCHSLVTLFFSAQGDPRPSPTWSGRSAWWISSWICKQMASILSLSNCFADRAASSAPIHVLKAASFRAACKRR